MINTPEIQETRDWQAVWEIYQHPEVASRVTNDDWERLTDAVRKVHVARVVNEPKNHAFLVMLDGRVVGCFLTVFTPDQQPDISGYIGSKHYHLVHTMLTRECRGELALIAGRKAMTHAFSLPDIDRLESWCPENNPEAYLFARMCGWKRKGFAPSPWVKHGIAYPVRVVAISKGEMI